LESKPAITVSTDVAKKSDEWLGVAHNEEGAGKNALISHEFFVCVTLTY
jgi:hypothetical protein